MKKIVALILALMLTTSMVTPGECRDDLLTDGEDYTVITG